MVAFATGVAFFDEQLSSMCVGWLQDCVYAVREAAITNLRQLTDVFGVEWAQQALLPQVLAAHTHTNYLYRTTVLYALSALAPVVQPEVLLSTMLPVAIQMGADPVANVRFVVAKVRARGGSGRVVGGRNVHSTRTSRAQHARTAICS